MKAAFPGSIEDTARLAEAGALVRAGGTDLQERIELGRAGGDLVDLRDARGLDELGWKDGGLRIGAMVRVAAIGSHPDVRRHYPGLAAAASDLATPQIRNVGTLGGNLLQKVRCWYFRNAEAQCYKSGGDRCRAREGDHLYHSCFDLGPCVAPHPSTLGLALLAYDGKVLVHGKAELAIADLYGDGSDPTAEHTLGPGDLLTAAVLPPPTAGERASYVRTIARARGEWPLVEALARVVVTGGRVERAAVAVGGVANIPLRLRRVEQALAGRDPSSDDLARAADLAAEGARPLPMTGYKVELVVATVLEALERAAAGGPA
ncbi:MAG: FAD binding domain-containing protein [Acidobacteriota bacterium]